MAEIMIGERAPSDPDAQRCLQAYAAEIMARFGAQLSADTDSTLDPLLIATLDGEPVGCGGLLMHPPDPPEVKRLWTAPAARGRGLARRLLGELERRARDTGAAAVRLDTNATLTEAIALYRSAGYREVRRYNDNPFAHHWFEKDLH